MKHGLRVTPEEQERRKREKRAALIASEGYRAAVADLAQAQGVEHERECPAIARLKSVTHGIDPNDASCDECHGTGRMPLTPDELAQAVERAFVQRVAGMLGVDWVLCADNDGKLLLDKMLREWLLLLVEWLDTHDEPSMEQDVDAFLANTKGDDREG